jgi:hypothetical protein
MPCGTFNLGAVCVQNTAKALTRPRFLHGRTQIECLGLTRQGILFCASQTLQRTIMDIHAFIKEIKLQLAELQEAQAIHRKLPLIELVVRSSPGLYLKNAGNNTYKVTGILRADRLIGGQLQRAMGAHHQHGYRPTAMFLTTALADEIESMQLMLKNCQETANSMTNSEKT